MKITSSCGRSTISVLRQYKILALLVSTASLTIFSYKIPPAGHSCIVFTAIFGKKRGLNIKTPESISFTSSVSATGGDGINCFRPLTEQTQTPPLNLVLNLANFSSSLYTCHSITIILDSFMLNNRMPFRSGRRNECVEKV